MRSPINRLCDATKTHEICYGSDQTVIAIYQEGMNLLELTPDEKKTRERELRRRERQEDAVAPESSRSHDDDGFPTAGSPEEALERAGILTKDQRSRPRRREDERSVSARDLET